MNDSYGHGAGDRVLMDLAASVGVSVYPGDGSWPDELVRCADGAMYRDKQRGPMPEAGAEATDEEARGVN